MGFPEGLRVAQPEEQPVGHTEPSAVSDGSEICSMAPVTVEEPVRPEEPQSARSVAPMQVDFHSAMSGHI